MARRKRHSPEQIVRKLEEGDRRLNAGQTIAQVCQALEVSEASFHRWRAQYGGMKAQEARCTSVSAPMQQLAAPFRSLFIWIM